MHTPHLTPSTKLINLPIPNITVPKPLFCPTTTPNYSIKPSTSLLSLPSRPFCCLRHHRSLNSPQTSIVLVRNYRLCLTWLKIYLTSRSLSVLASDFASPPYLICCGVPKALSSAYPFQHVYNTSQHSHLIQVITSSPIC